MGTRDTQYLPLAAGRDLGVLVEKEESECMFLVIKGLKRGGQECIIRESEVCSSTGPESQS